MPTKHFRDPSTQPQIGEDVVYLPEGIKTKVTGYEWETPTGDLNHAPKIKRYVLACGVTVIAEHIAQGADATPVAEKAEAAKVDADTASAKARADDAKTGAGEFNARNDAAKRGQDQADTRVREAQMNRPKA